MRIFNARPDHGVQQNGFAAICRFNVQITPELTLFDLKLVKSPIGKLLVHFPPTTYGAPSSSASPRLRAEIVELAQNAFEDELNDRIAAA